jgi:carbon starvation protein
MKKLVWILLSCLCAAAFAVTAGLFNPAEKISAIWLIVAAACFFAIGYRFYGAFLAARIAALDDARVTPALRLNDGRNYHPTNKWVLFGHHFAAIAGAGPLIGPVLAAQFGYLPGFLWIVIGSVLAGGVHDFIILFASVRHDGRSMAQIARAQIGPVSGGAALFMLLFVMIISISGLGLAFINSLYNNPWGLFIIAMTIPIALVMGLCMKRRPGAIAGVSAAGVAALLAAVIAGHGIPGTALGRLLDVDRDTLCLLLAAYGFIASALPVWLLLAPRDYLSSFLKIGVIIVLAAGVMVLDPQVNLPRVTSFVHGGGPVIPGTLFPFLFITIACGAVSGGHALFASGTTSKMIEKESYILPVAYGAMLTEGFVSVMALIAAGVLIPGDYFAINTKLSAGALAAMGFPVAEVARFSEIIGIELAGRPGGAVSLAVGMTKIFAGIPVLKDAMAYLFQFILMFEAFFILTTIDAGTRGCRYIVQELGGHIYRPFGDLNSTVGTVAASLAVVLCWSFFIFRGSLTAVWPMFGTANQLLAMMALCLGTTIIINLGKLRYAWVTGLPMLFMAASTFTAAASLLSTFAGRLRAGDGDTATTLVSAVLVAAILVLAVVILIDSAIKWARLIGRRPGAGHRPDLPAATVAPEEYRNERQGDGPF